MKKFFITLGVIFLVLIVAAGIGFWYFANRGITLDRESKAFVDAAIPAIVTNWNKKELLDRASPEFKRDVPETQIDDLLRRFTVLGRFMTFDSATGQAAIYASPQTGKVVTADYQSLAYFQNGNATIKVKLIQHDDRWQILKLEIFSPQLGVIGTDSLAFLNTLDKESKAYVDAAIPAVFKSWNEKELLNRASPEFKQAVPQQKLDELFHKLSNLGPLRKCEPAQGRAGMSNQADKQVKAEYIANATFDKGKALIDLALIKHGDQWQILGFVVKPPESGPR